MPLETWRCTLPPALRRARICGDAERLDIPDSVSTDLTGDGFDFDLHGVLRSTRSFTTAVSVLIYESAASAFLLRAVPRGRLVCGRLCFRARTQRTLAPALVAVSSALLLSPGDVLCHGQVSRHRNSRRSGGLGQTG